MLDTLRSFLEESILGTIGDSVSDIFKSLYDMVVALDPISQIGVLVLGAIIALLGTFSLIKKLSKLIFVVVVVFAIWYVLTNDVALPF